MFTVFANMRIHDPERLQHMKDSFGSFQGASDDWLINIRGALRNEALVFLREHLGARMTEFTLLNDSRGWIENALEMLPKAKYDYVLAWVEDHVCVAKPEMLQHVAVEMQKEKADYLLYSWWLFGKARKPFDVLELRKGQYIDTRYLTKEGWSKVLNEGSPYLISFLGIFHKEFFRKLLLKDRIKLPYFFHINLYRFLTLLQRLGLAFDQKEWYHRINGWFWHKVPRFPRETPFNLEKGPWRFDMLPFTMALAKQELFACIDDDLGEPGYSLVKRGLYPKPELRVVPASEAQIEEHADDAAERKFLRTGESESQVYYEDQNRIGRLLKKTVMLLKGSLAVTVGDTEALLEVGESVTLYSNVPHNITALTDSEILISRPGIQGKKIKWL